LTQTPASLLHRLREASPDADAWRQFDDLYRPLLAAWLRRYALQPHDADDLVQDILQTVAAELTQFHYDLYFPRLNINTF
jgi:RNA polymerase sigma-70 factor (ECF subfamily)